MEIKVIKIRRSINTESSLTASDSFEGRKTSGSLFYKISIEIHNKKNDLFKFKHKRTKFSDVRKYLLLPGFELWNFKSKCHHTCRLTRAVYGGGGG